MPIPGWPETASNVIEAYLIEAKIEEAVLPGDVLAAMAALSGYQRHYLNRSLQAKARETVANHLGGDRKLTGGLISDLTAVRTSVHTIASAADPIGFEEGTGRFMTRKPRKGRTG